jgi:hypothetical protein
VASSFAQVGHHFLIKMGDGPKPARSWTNLLLFLNFQQHSVSHILASGRNFNTNPKIFPAIESCGQTRQKLESSFEKYELSPPEVNRTISGSPFCKHSHEVCTSPSIEKPTGVDSGIHQSNRAVVQAFFQPALGGDLK